MYPEQYVLLQAVPAAERQAELAEKADAAPTAQAEASDIRLVMDVSTELSQEFPQKPRHRIIDELLAALLKEKKAREARNLNHWPEHGPKYLARLAARWRIDEGKRLERIAVFMKDRRKDAVRLALAVTDSLPDAEVAVSQTDLDLLSGGVPEEGYLRAAKMNALDVVRRRKFRTDKFVPLENAFASAGNVSDDVPAGIAGAERLDHEPAAQGYDDMDPLEILMRREERRSMDEQVQSALKDPRWRYIKRLKWAAPLVGCAKLASSSDN